MAKTSSIHRNLKRQKLVAKFAARRQALRLQAKDASLSPEDRQIAREKLSALPRNSSPTRVVTRCVVSGRARAVYKKFGLSRIAFRELALTGLLPGVRKASW